MRDFIINKQLAATRCEVCHQADMFNPATNLCSRCSELGIGDKPKKKKKNVTHDRFKLPVQVIARNVMAKGLFGSYHEQQEQEHHQHSSRMAVGSLVGYRPSSKATSNNHQTVYQKAVGYISVNGVSSYFPLPIKVKRKTKLNNALFWGILLLLVYFLTYSSR